MPHLCHAAEASPARPRQRACLVGEPGQRPRNLLTKSERDPWPPAAARAPHGHRYYQLPGHKLDPQAFGDMLCMDNLLDMTYDAVVRAWQQGALSGQPHAARWVCRQGSEC